MRDEHISRGEATRRTAGIAVLCGLAIAWLVALPYARVQGPQIAALLGAAIVAAVRLAAALAVAGGRTERAAWRGAVALGAIAAGGWGVTRAVAVPGVAEGAGHRAHAPRPGAGPSPRHGAGVDHAPPLPRGDLAFVAGRLPARLRRPRRPLPLCERDPPAPPAVGARARVRRRGRVRVDG